MIAASTVPMASLTVLGARGAEVCECAGAEAGDDSLVRLGGTDFASLICLAAALTLTAPRSTA